MEKKWTTEEIYNFLEWDYKRKNNQLGSSLRFKTVPELFTGLENQ